MAYRTDQTLECDMRHECKGEVTHIDDHGFIYCREHGIARKAYRPCRQLSPSELRTLKRGEPIERY